MTDIERARDWMRRMYDVDDHEWEAFAADVGALVELIAQARSEGAAAGAAEERARIVARLKTDGYIVEPPTDPESKARMLRPDQEPR